MASTCLVATCGRAMRPSCGRAALVAVSSLPLSHSNLCSHLVLQEVRLWLQPSGGLSTDRALCWTTAITLDSGVALQTLQHCVLGLASGGRVAASAHDVLRSHWHICGLANSPRLHTCSLRGRHAATKGAALAHTRAPAGLQARGASPGLRLLRLCHCMCSTCPGKTAAELTTQYQPASLSVTLPICFAAASPVAAGLATADSGGGGTERCHLCAAEVLPQKHSSNRSWARGFLR